MNKTLMAIACSAALMATSASAQPYVGIGVGTAKTDDRNTSYKIFAGIQSTQYFGVELAYSDFGDYRGSSADAWSLAATGTLPLDSNWDLFGKLGITENHTNFSGSGRRSDLLAGVGIGYNISSNIGVRLEYEDFGTLPNSIGGSGAKISNWGLNMRYTF